MKVTGEQGKGFLHRHVFPKSISPEKITHKLLSPYFEMPAMPTVKATIMTGKPVCVCVCERESDRQIENASASSSMSKTVGEFDHNASRSLPI